MKPPLASLLVVLSLLVCAAASGAQTLPPGFEDSPVVDVPAPTALAFLPDGRMLVASQPGQLHVVENGVRLATPALDLAASMCTDVERGLLGVAVDPGFASNGFVYLFYTFRKFSSCPRNAPATPVNRVSRFTMSGSTASRSSELVLVDNIPSYNANHNAGDLQFGRDGFLYIATGDGGCDYTRATGCHALNGAARYQHALVGKVLRITSTGGIPPTNPFQGTNSVRCNMLGVAQPGQVCQETFAWGLRNPWRLAFDPNAPGTRFFINDVGQDTWEEVNEAQAGADYGWNVREGPCARGSVTDCGPPPSGMTNPVFAYRHSSTCEAITGGAFVPSGVWPVEFEGAYLFADYTCGSIFRLVRSSTGMYTRTTFVAGLGDRSAVALLFGPHGGTQALYYLTYVNGGQARRISAVSGTNRAPTASATASPRFGPVPLAVQLDARGSTDPDGDTLTFDWNFGDGTAHATTAMASHTYTASGRFVAIITVGDGHGHTSTASVTIDAGNTPPAPAISSPSATARFAVGQAITLSGSASDAQDGPVPDSRLAWEVLLHHDTHTHPWLQPTSGNNLVIHAPAPEGLDAATTSYLEIRLTATDSQGTASTIRHDVHPRLVSVTLDSIPSGRTVTADGAPLTTPRTVTSWEGYALTIGAPTHRDSVAQAWLFTSWSDGGSASHVVVTPAAAATYTATFAPASTFVPTADAYVRNGVYAAQNFGATGALVVKHSTAIDNQRQTFVRFSTGTGSVGRAVLRLSGGTNVDGSVPVTLHAVADTTWSETALTWNTRPPAGTAAVATATIAGTLRQWYEFDVTAYVRAERAAGRTAVSFVVVGTASTNPYAAFSSRNSSTTRPELLISGQ